MSEILFIRHGQASFGKSNYDILSDLGKRQSLQLAHYLLNTNLEFHAVYTGTLERQKSTAHLVDEVFQTAGKNLPYPVNLVGLDEYNSSAIVNYFLPKMLEKDPTLQKDVDQFFTNHQSFKRVFEGTMKLWASNEGLPTDIESRQQFKQRVNETLEIIIKENGAKKNILVFTSGGIIAGIVQSILEISDNKTLQLGWQIINTSITQVKYSENNLGLHQFNSHQHLIQAQENLITYR